MWTFLAGAVVVVHLAYLAYAATGAFLGLRHPRWLVPHALTATWGVVVVAMQWNCPLTRLEKWLTARGGERPYDGAFVDRYVFGVLLPDGSQPFVFWLQITVFLGTYAYVAHRAVRRRWVQEPVVPV